jgi:hypothetical protein
VAGSSALRHRHRIDGEPRQRVVVVNSFDEATYWHNHPDLPRLARNMREQMEQQRMTVLRANPLIGCSACA